MISKLQNKDIEKDEEIQEFIRCTKVSLKFANANKLKELNVFIDEYQKVVVFFVNNLWDQKKVSSLIPKNITSQVQTWLTARAIQCAAKQASGIVRGTRQKQKKRLKQIEKFNKQGMFKKARKLQKIYDETKVSKPNIKSVSPELDSRFVETKIDDSTSFDGWITLTCLGNDLKIVLPFKKTKHFNKMLGKGTLKKGVRISKEFITFNFSVPPPVMRTEGKVVGLDKGIKSLYALSNGSSSTVDNHGHTMDSILKKMSRKKKGSKAFKKCQRHRKNYIFWCLNRLDLSGIKTINVEKLHDMRRGKRTSRYLSHFTYPDIKTKLDNLSLESGVQIKEVSPTYTSQRCSKCGWTRKANRKGKRFVCTNCGYAADADLNASLNISFDLSEISPKERRKRKSLKGFFWNTSGQELIVPVVQKAS